MTTRVERLKKLLDRAGAAEGAARDCAMPASSPRRPRPKQEAADMVERFDADDSLSALFPEVYHRRIGSALAREDANRKLATRRGGEGRHRDRAHQHGRAHLSRGAARPTSASAATRSGWRSSASALQAAGGK